MSTNQQNCRRHMTGVPGLCEIGPIGDLPANFPSATSPSGLQEKRWCHYCGWTNSESPPHCAYCPPPSNQLVTDPVLDNSEAHLSQESPPVALERNLSQPTPKPVPQPCLKRPASPIVIDLCTPCVSPSPANLSPTPDPLPTAARAPPAPPDGCRRPHAPAPSAADSSPEPDEELQGLASRVERYEGLSPRPPHSVCKSCSRCLSPKQPRRRHRCSPRWVLCTHCGTYFGSHYLFRKHREKDQCSRSWLGTQEHVFHPEASADTVPCSSSSHI